MFSAFDQDNDYVFMESCEFKWKYFSLAESFLLCRMESFNRINAISNYENKMINCSNLINLKKKQLNSNKIKKIKS